MEQSVSSWLERRRGKDQGSSHKWAVAVFCPGLKMLRGPQRQVGGVCGLLQPTGSGCGLSLPSLWLSTGGRT